MNDMLPDLTAPPKSVNQTEAPTSGATLGVMDVVKIAKEGLTEEEFDFVNLVHKHYREFGLLCTAAKAFEDYGILEDKWRRFMDKKSVQAALIQRGIPVREEYEDETDRWRNHALSAEQLFVADAMLDLTDTRSNKKKLQDLKISTGKWDAWLREPAFAAYLEANTSQLLKNGQHEAALALMDKVRMGDLKAIQYYHEFSGRFVPSAKQPAATNQENADLFNARQLINDLVEIIIEEVDDSAVAARIGDRLRQLASRNQVVAGLNGTTPVGVVTQPEVVANRVLTDKQKDLATQGVGLET